MHILKPFAKADPLLAQGLETIERNASQQAGLINDLLDLSRIISGKLHLVVEPTKLNALVQSAVDQIRPQAEDRGLTVDLGMPAETLVCDVDPVRLQQVVSNLLNNAVKFTPDGGRISVSLGEARDDEEGGATANGVIIEIADTGIGIRPDFLPHVFERFSQGHGGINRRYGGLGLGLAITRAIVEMHGGVVTASSPGLGYGSCFTVSLPRKAAHAARDHEGALDIATEEGEFEQLHLRVLVIEDSRDTLDMLKLWLDSHGCEVQLAVEGKEGFKLATENPPDLIISDIGMPEIDGYELIRKLRNTPGLEQVPAIALTGYAHEEDRELALAAGYNAHIAKPAEMGHLLHIVKKLTKK